jgi:hypothetical protein
MFKPRTLKTLALILAIYGLFLLPGLIWSSYLDSPAGVLLLVPMLSVYLFHKAGIPGLLEHDGLCGWGWCSPTVFGWLFVAILWLAAAWLMAWGLASVSGGLRHTKLSSKP